MDRKILVVFGVLFTFCCCAMNDIYIEPTKAQETQFTQSLKELGINDLLEAFEPMKEADIYKSVKTLQNVICFLNLVSSHSATLDAIDDYTLDRLCAIASVYVNRFAESYQKLKEKESFVKDKASFVKIVDSLLEIQ